MCGYNRGDNGERDVAIMIMMNMSIFIGLFWLTRSYFSLLRFVYRVYFVHVTVSSFPQKLV
jgi:hypothetical protein